MKKIVSYVVFVLFSGSVAIAQQEYQKPALEHRDSWSMVMIPDIQNYVKWGRNQPILDLMMRWIDENIDTLNIKLVVCVGDLVQNNEKITNDYDGNQTTQQQWEAASRAFGILDGKLPYIAASGNHDYSIDRHGNRTSRYAEFFTAERNHLIQKFLVQNSTNEQGRPTLENSALEMKGLHGRDYLFITTEFAPRDTVITWAKGVVAMEQYKDHRVVLITHSYLNAKDHYISGEPSWIYWEPYNIANQIQKSAKVKLPNANSGEQIWKTLVQPASNIELVLAGHVPGEGYRADKNSASRTVHQMLFDAQSMGGGHRNGNGGDGWLRLLEFFPDGQTVKVKTFSPLFAISPTSQPNAWKNDSRNEFTLKFD
ncbi:metallophosphoesterase [Parapedobacter soli]|uniref:metallophosphoesterase n=1 Tax=Parapedobacter soli TaxID=416955 RepID=UPI0021C683EB|nr:metallophosphoesterase [Parapedobacter soli]